MKHYRYSVEMKRLHRVLPTEATQQLERSASKLGKPTQLFHGTTPEAANNIIKDGFKLPTRGGMFGRGVYFAKDPLKSVCFAGVASPPPNNSWWTFFFGGSNGEEERWRNMLLCDVYLGKVKTLRRAQPGFTPRNLRRGCCLRRLGFREYNSVRAPGGCCGSVRVTEYVVYEQYQGIPRYLIEFDKEPKVLPSKATPHGSRKLSGQSPGGRSSGAPSPTATGSAALGGPGGATPPSVVGQAARSDQNML